MSQIQATEIDIIDEPDAKADGLPLLTIQQHAYAVNKAVRGMTNYAAYVDAYDCETKNRNTIDASACRLNKNPKVLTWMNHYRHNGAMLTAQQHIANLDRLQGEALRMKNPSAAVTAEVQKGKVSRLYVETIEISDSRKVSAADVAEAVASGDPEAVRELTNKLDSVPPRMH